MRTIAVFTGTRAEYGLLKRVMLGIMQKPECRLHTIVGGSHLSPEYGRSIEEIRADGIPVHDCPDTLQTDGTSIGVCVAMGLGLSSYGDILVRTRPDILVLLGDRFEVFAMAAAATVCRIPLAHVHGGEITEGAIDEVFRHAVTKMSHLHFPACETYRRRIIQLGESPDRVWNVGALGVENARLLPLPNEREIRELFNLEGEQPYILCTLHPVTLESETAETHCRSLLQALDAFPEYTVIFTGANADPGGLIINTLLQAHAASQPHRYRFFMSLGASRYLAAAKHAACVAGNSSSGIIEAPSLGVPVLDIGDRQKGRIRATSVLHCELEAKNIAIALREALRPEQREKAKQAANPYDKAGTAAAIVDIVAGHAGCIALQKTFYALPGNSM